jgi:hypothetical protein
LVVPVPQVTVQAPRLQSCPLGHTVPQAPQLALSVCRSRQVPSQLVVTPPQLTWHMPLLQICPDAQAMPQPPQCWLFDASSDSHPVAGSLSQSA